MQKSIEKSMEKCHIDPANLERVLSFRRYFINNLDTYHGENILRQVSKVLEKNNVVLATPALGPEDADTVPHPVEEPYEIIGTAKNINVKEIEHVTRIVAKEDCLQQMLACGTVILDISCDRDELRITLDYCKLLNELLEKQVAAASSAASTDDEAVLKKRYLILISTVMTWGCTKPLDRDVPEMPFTDTDFRKRKTHLNYKMHYDAENEVIALARKYRSQIGALVVATGVTYGGPEDVLYYWFQKAWEGERFMPILGRGNNIVPLINVLDLAQIIYNLIMDFPKKLYILAVEQTFSRQKQIIKSIGRHVGSGMFKCIPPEDAFLIPEIDQRIFDLMTLNLSMEPTFLMETMNLQWTSDTTFEENMPTLIKQFKKERSLKPFKLVVYGPPIVGKTTLAKMICEAYGLIYISPETAAKDLQEDLEGRVEHWEAGEMAALNTGTLEEEDHNEPDEDEGEDESAKEAAKQTLLMLRSGKNPTDDEVIGYIRQRLLNRDAMNRGWVLDGFPNTLSQCGILFDRGDERDSEAEELEEEEQFDEDQDLYNNVLRKLLPDIVVSLEATDEFICEKAMRQPEGNDRLDEEVVLKRLSEFRAGDARDVTPLNFFDELDVHPLIVSVKDHMDYSMKDPYFAVTLRMGRPCRYPKLLAIVEAAEKKEKEEYESLRHKEAQVMKELEMKIQQEREEKMEYWSELYSLMREEEEAALAAAGEPMRNYLVHHIFPTLTQALLEVAKLRPTDPIDYLAEYLFKLNPTGKMLEPGYNLQAEKLLGKIKLMDEALDTLDIKIDPLIPPEANVEDPSLSKKKSINKMSSL